ncbi:uncharacterized protein MYCFIDRAFT_183007 [Pseudocercospora fijiensis CIRAD86]|uniref:Uncharacterized protein n=1 Tax=Pseudocercospora fijiensis (strain CIRAD86) TaxID=383855 RepID=M2YWC0_PSEFD|nr:uncharacterized protein MYCFIDRAFT_183007 [Pseudocercospora fijiensis CIRAD86]EME82025.1 hypothetical protein MYCFIDRAFT_183007 [Pseudocercospora fijiensis CIRAD86]
MAIFRVQKLGLVRHSAILASAICAKEARTARSKRSMKGTGRLTVHRANQRIASAAKTAVVLGGFVTPRKAGWLVVRAGAGAGLSWSRLWR